MVPEINYIAVVLATLSSMLVGTVWYSPRVFGNYWMKAAGVTPSDKASDAVRPIIVTVIVSFITAWVLAGAAFIALIVSPGSMPSARRTAALTGNEKPS